ncbi:MAG TPA: putative porin, partial [Planctomycetota bacterium]|nr:putative porin [Planctomycetota bacterium]
MIRLGLVMAGVLLAGSFALAGESPDLQKQLDELKAKVDALEKQRASAPAAGEPAPAAKKSLWDEYGLKLSGDLRLRGDYCHRPYWEPDKADRERLRFRARLQLDAKANDEVDLRFRIATDETTESDNGADPTSNNQTMTNSFSKKGIYWDLAMFDYHPKAIEGLRLTGGKIEQPFIAVGKNELIWNASLTPEGGALRYASKFGDVEIIATAAGYWIQERNSATADNADSGMVGGQLAGKYNFSKDVYVLAGGGYFDYLNARNYAVFDYTGGTEGFGNTVSPDGEYVNDYNIAEVFGELGFACPLTGLPVSLFGDVVRNTATDDDAKAFLVGARVGKLVNPWDWSVSYDFRRVEKDAVIGAFCDSMAYGGGTNGKSHKVGAELQLMKNLSVGAYGYVGWAHISEND